MPLHILQNLLVALFTLFAAGALLNLMRDNREQFALLHAHRRNLAACRERERPERARPHIGGRRITIEWLENISRRECLYRFRFYAEELIDLAAVLQIPHPFKTDNRCSFSRIEALCLLLARFKSAGDMHELAIAYDRSQAAISQVVNELVIFLDDRWRHLLDFDSEGLLAPERMEEYADAIYDAGAPIDSIWGFLDCTIRPICHPSEYQRAVYNGHKKVHALKFQAVKLPNGLIGHLFGPMEGRRNDNALLAESRLLEKCAAHAFQPGADATTPVQDRYFQLFGDPAYGLSAVLQSPFERGADQTQDQAEWNAEMSAVRMEVEHGFGDVVRHWPFLNAWWKQRLWASPIGRYYRVGVLLANALGCLRPNQTAQYFDCEPPVLEEYFHDYLT